MLFVAAALVLPLSTHALSGTGVDNTKIKADAKHGGEWFRAFIKRTDDKGVLKAKNLPPGWYKFEVRKEDERAGQTLAVELRMLDRDGRRIKERTNVYLWQMVSGTKVSAGTLRTDKDGWIKVAGLSFNTEYKMDITEKDHSHVSKKDGQPRIKVKTKIKGDWFKSSYARTDENMVFEMKDVLPGKYKFKYKSGDRDPALPFVIKAQMRNDKGKKIKEPTPVNLYVYINKVRTPVGVLMTDDEGWITIPGVMTGMKYKIEVDD